MAYKLVFLGEGILCLILGKLLGKSGRLVEFASLQRVQILVGTLHSNRRGSQQTLVQQFFLLGGIN